MSRVIAIATQGVHNQMYRNSSPRDFRRFINDTTLQATYSVGKAGRGCLVFQARVSNPIKQSLACNWSSRWKPKIFSYVLIYSFHICVSLKLVTAR